MRGLPNRGAEAIKSPDPEGTGCNARGTTLLFRKLLVVLSEPCETLCTQPLSGPTRLPYTRGCGSGRALRGEFGGSGYRLAPAVGSLCSHTRLLLPIIAKLTRNANTVAARCQCEGARRLSESGFGGFWDFQDSVGGRFGGVWLHWGWPPLVGEGWVACLRSVSGISLWSPSVPRPGGSYALPLPVFVTAFCDPPMAAVVAPCHFQCLREHVVSRDGSCGRTVATSGVCDGNLDPSMAAVAAPSCDLGLADCCWPLTTVVMLTSLAGCGFRLAPE